jgi:hypothetical protein
LNQDNIFVDMNRNGVWDFRETPAQAWQRLGLLQNDGQLTREKYVGCVETAAGRLAKDGFFSTQTSSEYIKNARTADLQPKEIPARTGRE